MAEEWRYVRSAMPPPYKMSPNMGNPTLLEAKTQQSEDFDQTY